MVSRIYDDKLAAAEGLLGEVAEILNESKIRYVVLGGWIPYLFNSSDEYPHPGTYDVDILLHDETDRDQFDKAIDVFLACGYIRPAKNAFQLHKPLKVKEEDFLFHVDFLHRKYAGHQYDKMYMRWNRMQSIAGPGTDLIFLKDEYRDETRVYDLPNNTEKEIGINFASEVGFICAKGRSLSSEKRTRDSYDIFLVLKQSKGRNQLVHRFRKYYHLDRNGIVKKSIDNIKAEVESGRFVDNALLHLKKFSAQPEDELRTVIYSTVSKFFDRIGSSIPPNRRKISR